MVLSITPSEAQAILTELQPSMPALAQVESLVLEPGRLPLTVKLKSGLKVHLDLTVTPDLR
jgi:hypothetical protein